MFEHRLTDRATAKVYIDWFLLSFIAGFVNVGGFLSCQRFVTHITGFATLAGVEFGNLNFAEAIGVLSIPIYFLIGVVVSGYVTEKVLAHRSREKRFSPMMGVVGIMLGSVALMGHEGWFGAFGEASQIKNDYILLAILCMASGIQNAAVTSASGATVRTTHLTGITTDLGLGLIRAETHHLSQVERAKERVANALRLGFISFFIIGSAAGAIAFFRFKYLGFIIPALISFYVYLSVRFKRK